MKLPFILLLTFLISIQGFAQNVGIGTLFPQSRLHVKSGNSGVNSFYNPAIIESDENTYLNIVSPSGNETGLLFGRPTLPADGGIIYNNIANSRSLQFRTGGNLNRMIIDESGKLGIGVADPAFILDIASRMRLRSGMDGEAGIWLNAPNNTATQAFVGIENADHVGFFGFISGWKFTMNTTTGALKVNGNEGSVGQVITSNGNAAAQYQSLGSILKTSYSYTNSDVNSYAYAATNNDEVAMPALTNTITVSQGCRLIINASAHFLSPCAGFDCNGTVRFYFKVNGAQAKEFQMVTQTEMQAITISDYFWDVPAGTHTISFWFRKGRTDDNTISGNGIMATVSALPL